MIVEIPFLYRLEHLPPRKRRAVTDVVLDAVPVEIPEFTAAEAPLAFASPGSPCFGELPAAEVRLAGGVLVAPVFATSVGGEGNADVWATADTLADLVRIPGERRNPFAELQTGGRGAHAGAFASAPAISAFERSRHLSDDRELRIAAIQRAAAEWVFVAGAMCRRTDEPVWHVISNDKGDRPFVAVVARRHPGDPKRIWPGAAIYRADRLDAALDHARRRAARIGVDPDAVKVEGAIEVKLPEAVGFDDEGHALIEGARSASVLWRLKDGAPDLDAEMAAFDAAVAAGRAGADVARAAESLLAWVEARGWGEVDPGLRELVERREGLPETAARRAAEIDAALAAAYVEMPREAR